jgi:hypothetical protein
VTLTEQVQLAPLPEQVQLDVPAKIHPLESQFTTSCSAFYDSTVEQCRPARQVCNRRARGTSQILRAKVHDESSLPRRA